MADAERSKAVKLTPEEIELIRQAQDYGRRVKGQEKKIHCPFLEIDSFGHSTICKLCFKWMLIPNKFAINTIGHPCMEMDEQTIRSRFWRNPKLDESV